MGRCKREDRAELETTGLLENPRVPGGVDIVKTAGWHIASRTDDHCPIIAQVVLSSSVCETGTAPPELTGVTRDVQWEGSRCAVRFGRQTG